MTRIQAQQTQRSSAARAPSPPAPAPAAAAAAVPTAGDGFDTPQVDYSVFTGGPSRMTFDENGSLVIPYRKAKAAGSTDAAFQIGVNAEGAVDIRATGARAAGGKLSVTPDDNKPVSVDTQAGEPATDALQRLQLALYGRGFGRDRGDTDLGTMATETWKLTTATSPF